MQLFNPVDYLTLLISQFLASFNFEVKLTIKMLLWAYNLTMNKITRSLNIVKY